jgi:hypothetical protein
MVSYGNGAYGSRLQQEQLSEASKQELAEPEENEFLDYSFGV